MKRKIKDWVLVYVLRTVLVGASFGLLGNVAVNAASANSASAEESEQRVAEPDAFRRQEDRFAFLKSYPCYFTQYTLPEEKLEDQETKEFIKKGFEYTDTLKARGYFPSPDAIRSLEALVAGGSYDLGKDEGQNHWLLAYRIKGVPSPLHEGFTLMEPGSDQSMSITNYYLMDRQGMIEYLISLDSQKKCTIMKPQQLIFRTWLKGGAWEKLEFAEKQKMAARKLEEMARNPNYYLLHRVN